MAKNEENGHAGIPLKGLAAHILEEVIKADMTMHDLQTDAWKKFAEFRPRGKYINPDIHIGFPENRYLCLNEVKLDFHIKSIPLTFSNRVKMAIRFLRGESSLALYEPAVYDLCPASDEDAMSFSIVVKRFEDGTVKAEYKPADDETAAIMKQTAS